MTNKDVIYINNTSPLMKLHFSTLGANIFFFFSWRGVSKHQLVEVWRSSQKVLRTKMVNAVWRDPRISLSLQLPLQIQCHLVFSEKNMMVNVWPCSQHRTCMHHIHVHYSSLNHIKYYHNISQKYIWSPNWFVKRNGNQNAKYCDKKFTWSVPIYIICLHFKRHPNDLIIHSSIPRPACIVRPLKVSKLKIAFEMLNYLHIRLHMSKQLLFSSKQIWNMTMVFSVIQSQHVLCMRLFNNELCVCTWNMIIYAQN